MNGKQILIGVYQTDVRVPQFPTRLGLSVWLQLSGLAHGENEMNFRMTLAGRMIIDGGLNVSPRDPDVVVTIPIGPIPADIDMPGDLKFDIKPSSGGRWKNALTIPIAAA
jgi:hypothetical protein